MCFERFENGRIKSKLYFLFKGKTYELGGPHSLSMLEIHEIIFNTLKYKPNLAYVNKEWALKFSEHIYNFEFFGKDYITKSIKFFKIKNQSNKS